MLYWLFYQFKPRSKIGNSMNLNCGKFSSFQPFRQEGNYSKYVVCDRMDVCVCVCFYTSRSRSDCIWWWEENWEWEEETRPAKCRDLNNQNLKINCLLFSFRINFFSSNIPKNEKISNYLALLCSSNSRNRLL